MNGHAEAGLRDHRVPQQRYVPGFLSNDPFTPSISQSIRNRRMSESIRGMDDVGLPHRAEPRHRHTPQFETQQIPILSAQPAQNFRPTHYVSARQPRFLLDVTIASTRSRLQSSGLRKASSEQPCRTDESEVEMLGLSERRRSRFDVSHRHSPQSQPDNDATKPRYRVEPAPASARRPLPQIPVQPYSAVNPAPHPIPSSMPPPNRMSQRLDVQSDVKDNYPPSDYPRPPHPSSVRGAHPYVETMDQEHLTIRDYVVTFITETLPRQIYLHILLRLPYLYFSRVNRIFQEVDLTLEEVKEMALQACAEDNKTFQHNMLDLGHYPYPGPTSLRPAYQRLKSGWEYFIDDLMRGWNVISVLLLSAIMTMFQVQSAARDPVTRYIAFWSLICALMSLLYGCLFIIRFGTMRKASRAAEWALEARKSQTIFWNVWVLLAMPVIWLSWSILTFIACLMSFMWRAKANMPSDFVFSAAESTEFAFRIFICGILGIGVLYSVLIINTFRHYGTRMDEAWQRRVRSFVFSADPSPTPPPPPSWQFAQRPLSSPITPGPIAHHQSPPSRLRGLSDSDSGQTPYLAAGIGSRDLIGEWSQSKSAPQGDIDAISPPSRSKSPLRKSLEHRPAHWYRRSYSPRKKMRSSSPGHPSSQSARTQSPLPPPIGHERPPHSSTLPRAATGPSMSSIDLQPQSKEERKDDGCSNSLNRYNRPAPLDGGVDPIPPTKIPGEPPHITNMPGVRGEPEKLSFGYSQILSRSLIPSDSFEGRLEVSEHQ